MKKFLAILLSVILIISILPTGLLSITASAATSGTIGVINWKIDGTTLTISGKGAIPNHDFMKALPWGYNITNVIIINGVTRIGDYAFYNSTNIASITIPDSVTSIGNNAFLHCSGLTSITIPDSVTSIGNDAFEWCSGLTSITIPDSVTNIGDGAFSLCSSLTSITIPDSVTNIGNDAFSYCSRLTSITIPDSVTYIGNDAFSHCSGLTIVNYNAIDCTIGYNNIDYWKIFNECENLKTVNIGERVKKIPRCAFYGCSSLISITIPDNVITIGNYAFYGCTSLQKLTIGLNVTSIGKYAFGKCSGLEELDFNAIDCEMGSMNYDSFVYERALAGCVNIKTINIGKNVKKIPQEAFYNCANIASITIPDSVTSIGGNAFGFCTGLKGVYITDIVAWCGIDFRGYGNHPQSYASKIYYNNQLITDLVIPDDVTIIGKSAFIGCDCITTLTVSNGVTSISQSAFQACENLTTITIPNSVTSIEESAFEFCDKIKDIYYSGSIENKNEIEIATYNDKFIGATWHYNTCDSDAHDYSDDCDSTCNSCEWIRIPTHKWDTFQDKEEHWTECTECGEKIDDSESHIFDINDGKSCSVCKFTKKPSAPTVSLTSISTVILVASIGYEYSKDGTNWQTSNAFNNLMPNTEYTFYQRVAETEISYASEASAGLTVKTDRAMNTTEFKGGNGTDYAPYLISTKEHLNNVRKYPDAYFKQLNDIEFTAADFASGGTYYNNGYGWMPIGKDSSSIFSGTYDGGGFSIKNLKVDITTANSAYSGLFGYCTGDLKNITIENSDIKVTASGTAYAGGIVGYHTEGTIENCHNINTTVNAQYGGGVVGYTYYTDTINNCSNSGNVDGTYVGGIIGTAVYLSSISDCTNSGDIIKSKTSGAYIGGIVGYNKSGTLDISDCSNSGEIYAEGTDLSSISLGGAPIVGGIVGYSYNTNIENCSNSANIYGDYAGGIIGYGNTIIRDALNTGNISARTNSGGIVGYHNNGSVYTSTNRGDITGVRYVNGNIYTNCSTAVGGIIGAARNGSGIYECSNLGDVSNGTYSGGIVGIGDYVSQCYNNGKVTSIDYSGGICADFLDSYSKIWDCYNIGNISGKYAAGLLANMEYGMVLTSYSVGKISATESGGYIAAIVAYQTGGTVTDCYYLDNINIGVGYVDYSISNTPETIKLNKENMQNSSNFDGFDFDTIWTMDGNAEYPYPELKSVEMIYKAYTPGDLTGDDKINSLDGLMLLRHLNGWTLNIASPEAMDVNADGKVNSLDGLMLMRYLNGWKITLG